MRSRTLVTLLSAAVLAAGCAGSSHTGRTQPLPGPAPAPAHMTVGPRIGAAFELSFPGSGTATKEPAAAAHIARAEQGLTLRLLGQLTTDHSGNVTVSPWSLAVALAMLANGAHGTTRDQITNTLGTGGLPQGDQNAGWASLIDTLSKESASDGISLRSANAMWLQKGLSLEPAFMQETAAYFHNGVWQADFARDLSSALDSVNRWVASGTDGKITKLFDAGDVDRTTLLILANAVYFRANWQDPFDPAASQPGVFYSPGRQTTATFMEQTTPHASINPGYQEVRLSYSGGHYQAVAIMPQGQNLDSFLQHLSTGRLDTILNATQQAALVRMPRFTTATSAHLDATLAAMGMPLAFSPRADFSDLSRIAMQVQSVVQRDYLSVGERGTEAAAATGISMIPTAAHTPMTLPAITLNHPFLFLIRDTTTGTILFSSVVESPSGA